MEFCQHKNPLTRSGTGQPQRQRPGLQPDYVQLDERSAAELLRFAKRLAGQLRFYDLQHHLSGDWGAFFSNDISFLIAILANNETAAYREKWEALQAEVRTELNGPFGNIPEKLPAFKKLFDFAWSVAAHLDAQLASLPPDTALRNFGMALVGRDGAPVFRKLLGIYKLGISQGNPGHQLIDPAQRNDFGAVPGLRQMFVQDVLSLGLVGEWLPTQQPGDSWQDYFDNQLDPSGYQSAYGQDVPAVLQTPDEVKQRLLPSLQPLSEIFERLLGIFEKIAAEAPAHLENTLDEWPGHEPHVALYLAFVKLFRFAQQHLNGLKERHLDYFYKEVLRLQPRPQQPDEAHLILTLAKHVEDHLLKADTAFKAGKDSGKKEVSYTATANSELNRAEVAQLRAVFQTLADGKCYVAPVANSADGLGEEPLPAGSAWKPFGPVTQFLRTDGKLQPPPTEDTVAGELFRSLAVPSWNGFAVASPNLFLREGKRTVTLEFYLHPLPSALSANEWNLSNFQLFFSGEKGWIEKAPNANPALANDKLTVTCVLGSDDPPVVPFDEKKHGGGYRTASPLVLVRINGGTGQCSPYADLRQLTIKSVSTIVDVEGVRNLTVQNDLGRLDASKPFQPFGPIPEKNAILTIGSNEVFQKKLTGNLELKFEWEGPASDITYKKANATVKYTPLNLRAFQIAIGSYSDFQITAPFQAIDFSQQALQLNLLQAAPVPGQASLAQQPQISAGASTTTVQPFTLFDKDLAPQDVSFSAAGFGRSNFAGFDFSDNKPYRAGDRKGFLRLRIDNDFGHRDYFRRLPLAMIELSKGNTTSKAELTGDKNFTDQSNNVITPDPPYTPVAKSFSLNYRAASTFRINQADEQAFAQRQEQFFHLHPFGQREEHAHLGSGAAVSLLPQSGHEGALYIGLAAARNRQTVPILFQVSPGSANPLKAKQPVSWDYLHGDRWLPFGGQDDTSKADFDGSEVVDTTDGLLRPGIVSFRLPRHLDTENTWLDHGLTWLRATVQANADAICDFVDVRAQAVRVRFQDQGNAADFLATPLAAGQISKLVQSDAAVKKIEQPFSAFGNRPVETSGHFYRRVSERLRHKDRAITPWDYEHLVLEAFPEIYKVKCLNHTRLMPHPGPGGAGKKIDNEIAPGYVTVVTLPNLRGRNAVDPLLPYTDLGTLERVKQFLQKRISPHVQLEVVNPRFEQVQLEFQVQYREGHPPALFDRVLAADITQFLSPWAFENNADSDIEFGGRLHKSVVLDFVEERDYVDFVVQFQLHLRNTPTADQENIEEAVATTARSVLVSHAKHLINPKTLQC